MLEWLNENVSRAYPITEGATQVAVTGEQLPFDVIADLSVVAPRDESTSAFISMITITDNLVSISVAATASGLLVGTFPNSGLVGTVQSLSPVIDNASGFVTFGRGIDTIRGSFIFTDAAAAGLDTRAVRAFDPLPVTSIAKLNGSELQKLTGIIALLEGPNIDIFEDGGNIIVELEEDIRDDFVGPCDRQAVFTTCGRPPLREINGVGPDVADGKIIIEVE